MKPIVTMLFGSHLYGTSTPLSDTDYKSVHIPAPDDILLQRVRPVIQEQTKHDNAAKNGADDVDRETFALHRYFSMLEKGESISIEILFAPDASILQSSDAWQMLRENRSRLLTRECKGFVAYCQRQASKYGVKGSRVATSRKALALLELWIETYGAQSRLGEYAAAGIGPFIAENEHSSIVDIPTPSGGNLEHWEVCDRKLPYTITLKEAHSIVQKLFSNYGQRALAAERNEGLDWKALSHAVRVGHQALELLTTGDMTFPRPEREHLLAIKQGLVRYEDVAPELEDLLADVEAAAAVSTLPETVDRDFMEDVVKSLYGEAVRSMT